MQLEQTVRHHRKIGHHVILAQKAAQGFHHFRHVGVRLVQEFVKLRSACWFQSVASQDLTLLLSSGFQATSTNRAQSPLDVPVVLDIDNSFSAQLILRVPAGGQRAVV